MSMRVSVVSMRYRFLSLPVTKKSPNPQWIRADPCLFDALAIKRGRLPCVPIKALRKPMQKHTYKRPEGRLSEFAWEITEISQIFIGSQVTTPTYKVAFLFICIRWLFLQIRSTGIARSVFSPRSTTQRTHLTPTPQPTPSSRPITGAIRGDLRRRSGKIDLLAILGLRTP